MDEAIRRAERRAISGDVTCWERLQRLRCKRGDHQWVWRWSKKAFYQERRCRICDAPCWELPELLPCILNIDYASIELRMLSHYAEADIQFMQVYYGIPSEN